MSHEIEIHADGTAAFVSARQSAWHQLGTVLPDCFTAEQAMEIAKLGGWNVRKAPMQTTVMDDDGVTTLDVPGAYATIRTNPVTGAPEVLGRASVGELYTPVQNEDHCALLNALVDDSGAVFETAGSIRNGRQVFVTMKLPNTMTIGGTDRVDLYIAGINYHDGTGSFVLLATPIRVVCANTQAAALRNFQSKFVIRHTQSAAKRIDEAREALQLSFKWAEEFEREAEKMIQETIKTADFRKALTRLYPAPEGQDPQSRAAKNRIEKIDVITGLFTEGQANANIRGTRWAAYQAVTEYVDHFSGRGSNEGVSDARALRVITRPRVEELKNRAFNAFRVRATA